MSEEIYCIEIGERINRILALLATIPPEVLAAAVKYLQVNAVNGLTPQDVAALVTTLTTYLREEEGYA